MFIKTLLISVALTVSSSLFAYSESIWEQLEIAESYRTSDHKKFQSLLDKFDKSSNTFSTEEARYYLYLKGVEDAVAGRLNTALKKFDKVSKEAKNPELIVKSALLSLNSYAIIRKWEKGLLSINTLLNNLENITDNDLISRAYVAVSIFYNQLGEFELGLVYAKKVLNNNPTLREFCAASTLINESHYNLNKALVNVDNNLKKCEMANELVFANFLRSYQALRYYESGNYQKAISLLSDNLATVESINYTVLISEFYRILSKSYLKKNDLKSAEGFAKKIISLNDENIPYKPFVSAFNVLYEIENKKNNPIKAIEYFKKYHTYDKLNLDESKARSLIIQTANQKLKEKNSQIKLLNKQNEALNLEKSLSKKEAENKTLILIILGLIIIFISFLAYRTKRTHIKLKQLAEFDSLTGIHNRRHFTKQCGISLKQNKANGQAVSFILFDLDKFKSINDTYGHPAGDWALTNVSKPVLDAIRKMDFFGRMGGEEFAILLPGCELEQAREIAEDIRKGLMRLNTKESGYQFTVTASFGVTVSRISGYNFDTLMKHSDLALYESKHSGRNKTTVYSMPPTESNDEVESLN